MNYFMLFTVVTLALLMAVSLYRAAIGPTVMDRILGVNAIGSKTIVLLISIGFFYRRVDMFIDIALVYALLNFIAIIVISRYFYKIEGLDKLPHHGGDNL